VQELVKIGLSMRGVARKTGVSYSAVHRHAEQFSKRQTVVDVSVFEGRELGYVVGFFVGDGNRIADKRSGHYGAKFGFDAKRDVEIASFLQRSFEKASLINADGHVQKNKQHQGHFGASITTANGGLADQPHVLFAS